MFAVTELPRAQDMCVDDCVRYHWQTPTLRIIDYPSPDETIHDDGRPPLLPELTWHGLQSFTEISKLLTEMDVSPSIRVSVGAVSWMPFKFAKRYSTRRLGIKERPMKIGPFRCQRRRQQYSGPTLRD